MSELGGWAVDISQGPRGNGYPRDPQRRAFPSKTVANVRVVWERRRMLFRVAVCSLIVSTVIAFLIPKRYEASTQLMPPENVSSEGMTMLNTLSDHGSGDSGIGGSIGSMALGGIAGNLLGIKSSGALFVGILESRTVTDQIIEQFHLSRVYHAKKIEDAETMLWQHVEMSEDKKTGIVSITVTDTSPERAAAMAQAYVADLDQLVVQLSTSAARRERIFLEGRLKAVKADLDRADTKFSEFASQNTAIDVPAQGKAMVEEAAQVQGELIVAESDLREAQQIYAPTNVKLRAYEARISELKNQLQKLGGGNSLADIKSDSSLYPSIRKLPLLGVTYFDLYRESKMQETVFGLLTQQYELAKVEEAKEIPSVKVLDVAVVPTKKSYPHRLQLMILGTMMSLAAAVLWIFMRKWWDAIAFDDPGRLLIEEMSASARSRVRRFVAPVLAFGPAVARFRRSPGKHPERNEGAASKTGVSPERS